jgi:cell wall-associated NlpC family hydrolase
MTTKAKSGSASPGFTHVSKKSRSGSEVIGVGDGVALETLQNPIPKLRWVRGINSDLNDIRIEGEKLRAQLGNAVISATMVRSMHGASTLELVVSDPNRVLVERGLLAERHRLTIDGLHWRYVKCSQESIISPLTLTYEPEVVALLKAIKGPHKALRALVTRAEFCKRLALMANPKPRFICPELHKIQPVKKASESKAAANEALDERRGGIDTKAKLTVKGVAATTAQIQAGERALRTAESDNAPKLAKIAMMLALIVESVLGTAASNWYEAEPFIAPHTNHSDLEAMTHLFLTGYAASEPGAIGEAKAHPDWHAYQITQAVQKSGAGAASDGAGNYGPWTDEATKWVEEFGGASSTADVVTTTPYAFKQKNDESNWACMNAKAAEVNWRCFESAGWIYFMAEPTLLRQKLRMRLDPDDRSVSDLTFDYDVGKVTQKVTASVWAHEWEAPPGTAVNVANCGPANGVYLVQKITAPIVEGSSLVSVELQRPTKPLPEPAPTSSKSSVTFGGSSSGRRSPKTPSDAPESIDKMLAEMEAISGTPYLWGGGHASTDDVKKRLSKYDCSGAMSRVLYVGGFINAPATSGTIASMYQSGKGDFFVLYANSAHVWCEIKTTSGWVEWEEGGINGAKAGFVASGSQSKSGYSARHPKGT